MEVLLQSDLTLEYPFASYIHSGAAQVDTDTREWLWRTGLLCDMQRDQRIRAARFGFLAARAYPWASADGLRLASDWTTWLFMRDDMCDEYGLRHQPDMMREHCDILLRVLLEGPVGGDAADPLINALADMRERMLSIGGYAWMSSFASPVRDYFDACIWEATNRELGVVPDIPTYKLMRRYTGGVLTCLSLIELTDDVRLPLGMQHDVQLLRLVDICNDVICWSNDVVSAAKELREGDVHNLCIVVMRALGCGLGEATRCVTQMHNERVAEFLRVERQLFRASEGVKRYVSVLKAWMRANYDWSVESGRYRVPAEVMLSTVI